MRMRTLVRLNNGMICHTDLTVRELQSLFDLEEKKLVRSAFLASDPNGCYSYVQVKTVATFGTNPDAVKKKPKK